MGSSLLSKTFGVCSHFAFLLCNQSYKTLRVRLPVPWGLPRFLHTHTAALSGEPHAGPSSVLWSDR